MRCDTQDSAQTVVRDTDPGEEEKCTCATEDSKRTREKIPSLQELEEVLYSATSSCRHGDEVWPNLYLGDMFMSHDKLGLWQLGVTHVLNASHGKLYCKGSDDFYGTTVKYYGVPANDLPTFDLSPFFYPAAEFIHQALTSGGTVHVFLEVTKQLLLGIFSVFVSFIMSRKGVCALCCGRESLSCVGPSLLDDSSPPQSFVLRTLCATETLDFPKQRLPATAYSPGQKTAGRKDE